MSQPLQRYSHRVINNGVTLVYGPVLMTLQLKYKQHLFNKLTVIRNSVPPITDSSVGDDDEPLTR